MAIYGTRIVVEIAVSVAGPATYTRLVDIDAILRLTKSETLDLDALLRLLKSKTLDLDADIYNLIGWAWGQSDTSYVEIPEIWSQWKDSEGNPAIYDTVWGKLQFGPGDVYYSDVRDYGDATEKTLEITIDKYGSGSGDSGSVYWRGQAGSFAWDAGAPAWEEYTGATAKSWRYVQVRVTCTA